MTDVSQVVKLLKLARVFGTKNFGSEPKRKNIQGTINMNDLNNISFDLNNYPSYSRRVVLPVGNNLMEIKKHNEDVREIHMKIMAL